MPYVGSRLDRSKSSTPLTVISFGTYSLALVIDLQRAQIIDMRGLFYNWNPSSLLAYVRNYVEGLLRILISPAISTNAVY